MVSRRRNFKSVNFLAHEGLDYLTRISAFKPAQAVIKAWGNRSIYFMKKSVVLAIKNFI